jgi:hypothetical protein
LRLKREPNWNMVSLKPFGHAPFHYESFAPATDG